MGRSGAWVWRGGGQATAAKTARHHQENGPGLPTKTGGLRQREDTAPVFDAVITAKVARCGCRSGSSRESALTTAAIAAAAAREE